jgi:tetratricopeptide (TPR) repeat protein
MTTAIQQLATRYQLGSSPDWQALLTHFDLGEGFAFIVLLVPNNDGAEVCREALDEYLNQSRKRVLKIAVQEPGDLKDLSTTLPGLQVPIDCGAVWAAAAVPEAVPDHHKWLEGWSEAVARLNHVRNGLLRHFKIPLIFVGAPWLQEVLRENAPDLWSVRTLVASVEPRVESAEFQTRGFSPDARTSRRGPDPELAMGEANRLRGEPGKELAVARLLFRAGLGFEFQYRIREAAEAFSESSTLRKCTGAPVRDQADALLHFGQTMRWILDYSQATEALTAARSLYRDAGDPIGEAKCLWGMGNTALDRSQYEVAQGLFEQARTLYRRAQSVVGEADCVRAFGLIAMAGGSMAAARKHYEEALKLYRRERNVFGEASCLSRIADVALNSSDYVTAQARFEEALTLFQSLGDVFGETQCIFGLGRLAAYSGDLEAARRRYDDALTLFRRVGNVLGEANCFRARGQVAAMQGETGHAREEYSHALLLYAKIPDPIAIGMTHRGLARISSTEDEREKHIAAAREAWSSIGRQNLVAELDQEFQPVPVR